MNLLSVNLMRKKIMITMINAETDIQRFFYFPESLLRNNYF